MLWTETVTSFMLFLNLCFTVCRLSDVSLSLPVLSGCKNFSLRFLKQSNGDKKVLFFTKVDEHMTSDFFFPVDVVWQCLKPPPSSLLLWWCLSHLFQPLQEFLNLCNTFLPLCHLHIPVLACTCTYKILTSSASNLRELFCHDTQSLLTMLLFHQFSSLIFHSPACTTLS